MNSTQNKKIEQVNKTTMIVGIDVGSEKHYFRAFASNTGLGAVALIYELYVLKIFQFFRFPQLFI